jgi:hypothetical protein
MGKRKVKTDKQYHGQKKRKEKTAKQYHGQKKRQTNNTIVKRKEKTDKQYHAMVLFFCLYLSFDHGIVCLSLFFF